MQRVQACRAPFALSVFICPDPETSGLGICGSKVLRLLSLNPSSHTFISFLVVQRSQLARDSRCLREKVVPLRQVRCLGRGCAIISGGALAVSGQFQADALERRPSGDVPLCGRPLRVRPADPSPFSHRAPSPPRWRGSTSTIGLSDMRLSRSYSARICGQSVSSARAASS